MQETSFSLEVDSNTYDVNASLIDTQLKIKAVCGDIVITHIVSLLDNVKLDLSSDTFKLSVVKVIRFKLNDIRSHNES